MYGAVLFDDAKDNGAGWATVVGGQPFRFQHPFDLEQPAFLNVVCWWTNSTSQWSVGHRLLKPNDYLRPAFAELVEELDISSRPPAVIVKAIVEVFGRVMSLARIRYGVVPDTRLTLADELMGVLVDPIETSQPPAVNDAFRAAYRPWTTCSRAKLPERSRLYRLTLPRLLHARAVLATPTPNSYWSYVPERNMPPASARLGLLVDDAKPKPIIVRAVISGVEPSIAEIVNLESDEEGQTWLTHAELLVLSRFSDVVVNAAYSGGVYLEVTAKRELVVDEPFEALSLSGGILAAAFAEALSTPQVSVTQGVEDSRIEIHSPRGVWLSSTDRLLTMTAALSMHAAGFVVKGYGRGVVSVECPREHVGDFRRAARDAGLELPLGLHKASAMHEEG